MSPRMPGSASQRACVHLVEAVASIQRAGAALDTSRRALGPVPACDEVWAAIDRTRRELLELEHQVVGLQRPDLELLPSHSGTGCRLCELADRASEPESHGERRSGGAS